MESILAQNKILKVDFLPNNLQRFANFLESFWLFFVISDTGTVQKILFEVDIIRWGGDYKNYTKWDSFK